MRGTLFGGPYNKDPTSWGTRLGPPYFRKRPQNYYPKPKYLTIGSFGPLGFLFRTHRIQF